MRELRSLVMLLAVAGGLYYGATHQTQIIRWLDQTSQQFFAEQAKETERLKKELNAETKVERVMAPENQ